MNQEHPQIQTLQRAKRDQDTEDSSPWEKLAAGTLSEEEHAALRKEAEQTEEGRRLYELYRPFDADEKQRLYEGVRAQIQWAAQKRRRNQGIGTVVFAMAASIAPIYLALRAPLVDVALSGSLGPALEQITRLDTPDAELSMNIVPMRPIKERLAIRGALLVRDDQTVPWAPHENPTSADNKIRIAVTRKDLPPCLAPGEWTVLIAVGVPGAAPPEADMRQRAGKGAERSYQVLSKRLWLEGPPVGSDGRPCPGALR